tara:strand:- start:48 stop:284 length:237 start_codon:yes stop_codon:yes gene_type:complete
MLMNNQIIVGVTTAVGFGVLSWMAYTLIEVDKRTEVMSVTVSKNHEMLKPLWEDFIRRSAKNGNGEIANGKAGFEIWK